MGRLIDEDDIIAGLEYGIKTISDQNIGFNYMRLLGMTMKMVRDLPTAYDIEAVVKELEEEIAENQGCSIGNFYGGYREGLNKAIEIVKGDEKNE